MASLNKFFDEWQDNRRLMNIFGVGASFGLAIIVLGYATNFPEIKPIADIFLFMLIAGAIVGIIDYIAEKNKMIAFIYTGRSWKKMWQSFLVGGVAGFLLYNSGLTFGFTTTGGLEMDYWSVFFFTVIIASYAEEKFFRMAAFPTFYMWMNNLLGYRNKFMHGVITLMVISIVFALYHINILGFTTDLWFPFIFSVIAIVGNYWLKSGFFGVGLHMAMNFLWFSVIYGI